MKINKMLVAIFATLAVFLSSCKDDDPTVGIDSGMPVPADVTYDEINSGNSSIAVYWDAKQAISAGATSFTVQLVKTADSVGDVYDTSVSKTILTTASLYDATSFEGLTAGRIYYVRIRANYPRSVYSDWTFCTVNGEPARIMVGKGCVSADTEEESALAREVVSCTESTAIVRWSTCNYASNSADAGYAYLIELFKDEACTDLEVSWSIAAGELSFSSNGARFIFSGLESDTDYWFRVTNTTDDVTSSAEKFHTAVSQFKEIPATAAEGDIILFQDFHEFVWGGDLLNKAAGYSNNARASATSFEKATGVNPVSAEKFYLCAASTEIGLFNTQKNAVVNSSLKDWGQQSEEKNGEKTGGVICTRPGMAKMGASSFRASLITPELSCLTQPATIEVTFKTAAYDDAQNVIVELLDGTTKTGSASWIRATSQSTVATVNAGSGTAWTTHTVTVPNVTSTSRIGIGAAETGEGAAQHRFYLDDIQIKLISYGELSAPDAPAKPTLSATDKTITVEWEKVSRATGYKVEYKKTADTEWTVVETDELTCTIEGLEFETSYDVRVKATIGELESEYSEVATVTTLAEIKQLATPQNVTAEADYGVATLTFDPVTGATDYEVYANGATEKLVGMITSEATAAKVTYKVTGLAFNTNYTFQVKAVAEGVTASELSAATESSATNDIHQIKNNVGPTTATIAWRKNDGEYTTTLSSPFDPYTFQIADKDGNVLGTIKDTNNNYGAGAATINGANNPSRFTFGALTPATTYKVRLKKLDEDDLLYSPWCEITTEAAHVKGNKEVLYQGFDEAWYGGDIMNQAAAMKCVSPNTTSPVMTWESYLGNETTQRLADESGTTAGSFAGALCKLETSSFYGYTVTNTAFRCGYAKLGGSKTVGVLTTAVLGEEVLNATTATPCTISFKVAPYSETTVKSEAKAKIIVVHADGSTTVAIEDVDVKTNEDPFNYVWKTVSVSGVGLLSTDKLQITDEETGSNTCRFCFDELLVVAE